MRKLRHARHGEDHRVLIAGRRLSPYGAVPAVKGAEAIARIRAYVERSTSIEFKILDSWVRGSVVVNERMDAFTRSESRVTYHLTGVFLVKDGKIIEWADYTIQ